MGYEDWIPDPPDPADPTFQGDVAVEYGRLASEAEQAAPVPGKYFKYQIFSRDFLRVYDRVLLFHEAGTGKTCSYISVAEDFRDAALRSRLGVFADALLAYQQGYQGLVKHVYVLLKASLIEEFKNQLLTKCGEVERYAIPELATARTPTARKQAITRYISKWYTLDTYTKFYNRIQKRRMTPAQMADEFHGCLFVMDEIHSLRTELVADADDRAALGADDLAGLAAAETRSEEAGEEAMMEDDPDQPLYTKIYRTLWDVVHRPKWCKVVLATATPMINSVADLVDPMNLLLPADRQVPRRAALKDWTLARFRQMFMGYVSYVRAGDTGVDVVTMGSPLSVTFPTPAGPAPSQLDVVRVPMSDFQQRVYLGVVEQRQRGVRNNERQASNLVFPDGSYGGMFLRMNPRAPSLEQRGLGRYIKSPTADVYTPTPEWRAATRTLADVRRLSNLYATIIEGCRASPGLCFVYQELFTGSGAIALAMCMESLGFARFKSTVSVVRAGEVAVPPRLRYGMITRETTEAADEALKELFNSPENADGRYVKVLLGAKVVRDGINLSNVVDVFLPSMWTPSGMYQAMQRAIRATSHTEMVAASPTGRVEVRIHRMASVARRGGADVSVDLDMYAIAEAKDREIAVVRRKLKQVAVDCWLNYARNVRAADEDADGTPQCDYDVCTYACVDPAPAGPPPPRAFPQSGQVKTLVEEVLPQWFTYRPRARVADLVASLSEYAVESEIVAALAECARSPVLLMDRFGQPSQVAWAGDEVMLVPPATEAADAALLSYYREHLVVHRAGALRAYVAGAGEAGVGGLVEGVAARVEAALAAGEDVPEVREYTNFIFRFRKPVRALAAEAAAAEARKRQRGRKPKEAAVHYRDAPLGPDAEDGPEEVVVHMLYTLPAEVQSYNSVVSYENAQGRLRLLEGGAWRDATLDETAVYNALVRGRIQALLARYEATRLYGSVYADERFRIHDLRQPEAVAKGKRERGRGRQCAPSNFELPALRAMVADLGGTPPPEGATYGDVCGALQAAFAAAGRLFVLIPKAD